MWLFSSLFALHFSFHFTNDFTVWSFAYLSAVYSVSFWSLVFLVLDWHDTPELLRAFLSELRHHLSEVALVFILWLIGSLFFWPSALFLIFRHFYFVYNERIVKLTASDFDYDYEIYLHLVPDQFTWFSFEKHFFMSDVSSFKGLIISDWFEEQGLLGCADLLRKRISTSDAAAEMLKNGLRVAEIPKKEKLLSYRVFD
jgi:hypothetical protein